MTSIKTKTNFTIETLLRFLRTAVEAHFLNHRRYYWYNSQETDLGPLQDIRWSSL